MPGTKNDAYLLQVLHSALAPSTGCTEPGAIALNTATARKHAQGEFRHLTLRLDAFLYKNAKCVGIPGTSGRGVDLCAAVGITGGDADAGYDVLHSVSPAQAALAQQMVSEGHVAVEIINECDGLFIQSILETDADCVCVTTRDAHDNIVEICHAAHAADSAPAPEPFLPPILSMSLSDLLAFVQAVPLADLAFLQDGVEMNLRIAQAGSELDLGRAMRILIDRGALADSPVTRAKLLSASASYARMCGISLPVMTATGSGNQGITITMTIEGFAQVSKTPEESKLRALALAHLVNVYGKAHLGNLSAICACGVSSGLGAAIAVVYMLGGDARQMLLAAQNMIGSICGMICDGAKEGCASKVELAAGLAVQSAYLAMEGVGVPESNGILSGDWKALFENLGALAKDGMRETNRVIVRLMEGAR